MLWGVSSVQLGILPYFPVPVNHVAWNFTLLNLFTTWLAGEKWNEYGVCCTGTSYTI